MDSEDIIVSLWETIESYLRGHGCEVLAASLNSGAKEEEIAAAESVLGVRLPEDYRASLRRHNGQSEDLPLIGMGPLLSTEEIITQWRVWKELLDDGTFDFDDDGESSSPDAGVKADWWNPRWIPITHDGGGDHDCIDLDPAQEGNLGQIIEMFHDDDSRPLKASSFTAWLAAFATELEQGNLVWSDVNDCLERKQDI